MKQIIEALEQSHEYFRHPRVRDEYLMAKCEAAIKRVKEIQTEPEQQQPLGYCCQNSLDKYKAARDTAVLIVGNIKDETYCIPVYEKAGL